MAKNAKLNNAETATATASALTSVSYDASIVPGPWQIGKAYSIRTVTMALHGILVAVYPTELVLEKAAWIADTGRFSNYTNGEDPNEVEPFPQGEQLIVGRQSIIDAHVRPGCFNKQK
jgi:hypothetical protein